MHIIDQTRQMEKKKLILIWEDREIANFAHVNGYLPLPPRKRYMLHRPLGT